MNVLYCAALLLVLCSFGGGVSARSLRGGGGITNRTAEEPSAMLDAHRGLDLELWPDGTKCPIAAPCPCKNKVTFHYATNTFACGLEPKTWDDGRACVLGATCNACKNEATWWTGRTLKYKEWLLQKSVNVFTACGSEPCWLGRTSCLPGVTCHKCCSEAKCFLGILCKCG